MKTAFWILLPLIWTLSHAAPLKLAVTVTDSNGDSFGANIVFDENEALEFGPELSGAAIASFNLASAERIESGSGSRVTLAQARNWAAASKTKALASLDGMTDPGQRAFVEELLSPSFAVSESPSVIHLKSQFLSYTASEPLTISAELKKQIFAFDELNAFRKAMVLRQTPPFAQLEVTRVLRERGFVPGLLITEITTPGGSIRVTTRFRLNELTPEEAAIIKRPNQSPEPTALSVTPRADARVAPASTVAHL